MGTRENGIQNIQQTMANKVPMSTVIAQVIISDVNWILKTTKGFKGFQYKAGAEQSC